MKASELRIGNLVNHLPSPKASKGLGQVVVNVISDEMLNFGDCFNEGVCELEYFEPIPLTEEWLVKFGFSRDLVAHNHPYTIIFKKSTSILGMDLRFNLYIDDGIIFHTREFNLLVSTVHQLQNLYFALTGEELKINL